MFKLTEQPEVLFSKLGEEEFINKDFSSFNAFYDQRTGIVIFVGIESDYPLSLPITAGRSALADVGCYGKFLDTKRMGNKTYNVSSLKDRM